MPWLNEPQKWKQEGGQLSVFADAHTDFWRKTHYGFVRDNGHFYYEKVSGNFEIETEFRGKYESLYDQAGLMVRLDDEFLGLGVQPPMSSWGVLIKVGAEQMEEYPWQLEFPAAMFSLTLLSLNFRFLRADVIT